MKHWGYSANEAMGWMRVCRPGSVIGPQQQYLVDAEAKMWREGAAFRKQRGNWHEQPLASHKPPPELPPAAPPAGGNIYLPSATLARSQSSVRFGTG